MFMTVIPSDFFNQMKSVMKVENPNFALHVVNIYDIRAVRFLGKELSRRSQTRP